MCVAPNLASAQIFADLDQNDLHSRPRSQLEQRRADVDRYGHSCTEPTLDEMLREPAIRLMMRRDNVAVDQLLHLINTVCRHTQIEQHRT